MTLEQIQKKKAELIEQEKKLLKQEKERQRKEQARKNLARRKLETRMAIYIGKKYLAVWQSKGEESFLNDIRNEYQHAKREQDKKLIQDYANLIKS